MRVVGPLLAPVFSLLLFRVAPTVAVVLGVWYVCSVASPATLSAIAGGGVVFLLSYVMYTRQVVKATASIEQEVFPKVREYFGDKVAAAPTATSTMPTTTSSDIPKTSSSSPLSSSSSSSMVAIASTPYLPNWSDRKEPFMLEGHSTKLRGVTLSSRWGIDVQALNKHSKQRIVGVLNVVSVFSLTSSGGEWHTQEVFVIERDTGKRIDIVLPPTRQD